MSTTRSKHAAQAAGATEAPHSSYHSGAAVPSISAAPPTYTLVNNTSDTNTRNHNTTGTNAPLNVQQYPSQEPPHPNPGAYASTTPSGGFGISGVAGYGRGPQTGGGYFVQNPGMELCIQGKHDFRRNYGIVGIIFAIACFPCGLIGLCLDKEDVCRRCGFRQE